MTVIALDVAGHRVDLPELLRRGRPFGKLNSDSEMIELREKSHELIFACIAPGRGGVVY